MGGRRGRDARADARAPAARAGHDVTVLERSRAGRWPRQRVDDPDTRRRRHVGPPLPRHPALGRGAARRARASSVSKSEMAWVETKTGYYDAGRLSSVSNVVDFLRLPGSAAGRRLRLAATIQDGARVKDWQRLEQETVATWLTRWSGRDDVPTLLVAAAARQARRELARRERRVHLGDHPAPVRGAPHRAEEGDVRVRPGRLRADPRAVRRRARASGASTSAARRTVATGSSAPTTAGSRWSSTAASRRSSTRS